MINPDLQAAKAWAISLFVDTVNAHTWEPMNEITAARLVQGMHILASRSRFNMLMTLKVRQLRIHQLDRMNFNGDLLFELIIQLPSENFRQAKTSSVALFISCRNGIDANQCYPTTYAEWYASHADTQQDVNT